MLRSKWFVRSMLALGLVAAVAIPVLAHGHSVTACKDMAKKMDEGKSTLLKAVEAAEAASKGKALTATARMAEDKLVYAVYCLVGDKIQQVTVDATGKAGDSKEVKELPGLEDEHAKPEKGEKEPKPDKKDKATKGG